MKIVIPLLLVLILFSGCSKNQNDLQSMANEKDTQGLIEFISDNQGDSIKSDLVKFAINLLISKDLTDGKKFLETMIRKEKPKNLVVNAVESYYNNKKPFESVDSMMIYYFHTVKTGSKPAFFEQFRSVMTYGDRKLMAEKFRTVFIREIEKDDYKMSGIAVDFLVNSLKIDDSLSSRMQFLIHETINLSDNSKDGFSSYVDGVYISQLSDSIKKFYSNKRNDFEADWNTRNPKPETFDRDDVPSEAFYLTGYIVGKNRNDSYEIIVPGQTYRALLYTSYTSYTTKGSFTLPVQKTGTQNVTVKEEFGGFSQEWNTYSEVKPEAIKRWQAYKNSEILHAQYQNNRAATLIPALDGFNRTEEQEIQKLANKKDELAKKLSEQFESYKKEIRDIYKSCFLI
ncbi:MAG: hypothetical protein LCH52_06920 [Bacteroidetes bacterium]|nr:hypothetical protein [Bacteroidota bacterium]